jgi:DNA-directed RNA polymerase subunit delta
MLELFGSSSLDALEEKVPSSVYMIADDEEFDDAGFGEEEIDEDDDVDFDDDDDLDDDDDDDLDDLDDDDLDEDDEDEDDDEELDFDEGLGYGDEDDPDA